MNIGDLNELHSDFEMRNDDIIRILQYIFVLLFFQFSSDDSWISSRIEEVDTIEDMRDGRDRSIDRSQPRKRDDPIGTISVVRYAPPAQYIPVFSHIDHVSLDHVPWTCEVGDGIIWMVYFPEIDP